MTTLAKILATSIRDATSKLTDAINPSTVLTRNDANDYFTALLRSRDITPGQLIALGSRSFDDEARILTSRYEDGVAGFSNMAPDLDPDVHLPRADDLVTEMQARSWLDNPDGSHPTISQSARDLTPDQLAARDDADLLTALLNSRDVIPEHEIEARSKIGDEFKNFFTKIIPAVLNHVYRPSSSAKNGRSYATEQLAPDNFWYVE